jgi:hypothetical protein
LQGIQQKHGTLLGAVFCVQQVNTCKTIDIVDVIIYIFSLVVYILILLMYLFLFIFKPMFWYQLQWLIIFFYRQRLVVSILLEGRGKCL